MTMGGGRIRAVVLRAFGPPVGLIVEDVPDPVAGPGQALIRVEIANITFVETQVRAGQAPHPSMLPPLPAVLGNGVGGTVAAVGGGVDPELLGRRAVSTTGGSGGYAELAVVDAGGYAELAVVDAGGLVEVPQELGLADAVALLADGRTALALMRLAKVQVGERVLVEAAAGGVGSLLVQMAGRAGATVVATAGGPAKVSLAKERGATIAVDYSEPERDERVRAQGGPVDVVFDGVGGEVGRKAFNLLRDGGRFCMYGMASGSFTDIADDVATKRALTVLRGVGVNPADMRELTASALAEAAAGRLRPLIGQTFPLDQAAAAHAAMASRTAIGKTLLLVSAVPDRRGLA
jgi:NADPH2:quinone reductase